MTAGNALDDGRGAVMALDVGNRRIGVAVTEIATLRGELSGRPQG